MNPAHPVRRHETPAPGESDTNLGGERTAWQARSLDETTRRLLDRDRRAFLSQSVSTPCLNTIAKAEGLWIEDTAGRRYMDFHGNNVHHVGYGHPRVVAAIKAQLDALPFAPRRYTCEPSVRLAEELARRAPFPDGKVLFTTGGSDALEVALKVARAATGRFKTISFWDAFHGAGFGAASVGGESLFRSGPIGPLLPGAEHVAPFACYRCPYGYRTGPDGAPPVSTCRIACANMVRYALERERDVAAVVAEPARAVPYLPPPGFWRAVREACDEFGALLVFDEIPTGLGKTGRFLACDHDGVVPDILVMGKALGGGILPIAAAVCREGLDVAGDFAFGHYTHEKNPVTAAAGLATLAVIDEEDLVANAARVGARALERMAGWKDRFRLVGDVRGRGFLLGAELVKDRESREPANEAAERVLYRALDRGLSFKTSMGNVLTLTPPLVTTEAQMDRALGILEECIAEEGS